jgi:hypothetical protein
MDASSISPNWAGLELLDILRYHVNPSLHHTSKTIASCRLVCRAWRSSFYFDSIQIDPDLILECTEGSNRLINQASHLTFSIGDSSSLQWFDSIANPRNSSFASVNFFMLRGTTTDDAEYIYQFLSLKWAHLKSFTFRSNGSLSAEHLGLIAEAIGNTPISLESLSFDINSTEAEGSAALLLSVLRNKTIRELDLSHCALAEDSGNSVIDFIKQNRTITSLNLGHNYDIEYDPIRLREAIATDTTLRELNLDYCPIDESFYQAFEYNSTLISLSTQSATFEGGQLPAIFAALQRNNTLQSLKIGFDSMCEGAPIALGMFLKTNTTLQKLKIGFEDHCALYFGPMFDALTQNPTLTALDVSSVAPNFSKHLACFIEQGRVGIAFRQISIQLSDISKKASRLMRALATLPKLERLNFTSSMLGPNSVDAIADLVEASTSLKKLDLYQCQLGDEGVIRVCAAVARNSTLRHLCFGGDTHKEPVFIAVCDLIAKHTSLECLDFSGSDITADYRPMFEEAIATSCITYVYFSDD